MGGVGGSQGASPHQASAASVFQRLQPWSYSVHTHGNLSTPPTPCSKRESYLLLRSAGWSEAGVYYSPARKRLCIIIVCLAARPAIDHYSRRQAARDATTASGLKWKRCALSSAAEVHMRRRCLRISTGTLRVPRTRTLGRNHVWRQTGDRE